MLRPYLCAYPPLRPAIATTLHVRAFIDPSCAKRVNAPACATQTCPMESGWHPRVTMHRRSIRLRGYDYSRPGAYFVTICATTHLFGRVRSGEMILSRFGDIARECWTHIPDHFLHVRTDAFVVMPDHVHGILLLRDHERRISAVGCIRAGSLGAIVRSFKSVVAARVKQLRGGGVGAIWQRNYFDRIIRTAADLDRVRRYIMNNPARWSRQE
jgi:putative transposase